MAFLTLIFHPNKIMLYDVHIHHLEYKNEHSYSSVKLSSSIESMESSLELSSPDDDAEELDESLL